MNKVASKINQNKVGFSMKRFNTNLLIIFSLMCAFFVQNLKSAEEPSPLFWLGLYGDYNRNIHVVDFNKLPGVASCCPQYTNGTGNGYSFGALFEVNIIKSLNFQLRLGFSNLDALLSENENAANTIVIENGVETVKDLIVEHTLKAKIHGLGIEPLINFKMFEGLTANFGFNLSYFFTEQIDQLEKIVTPSNLTFWDGRLIRNDKNGIEIPDRNPIQFFGVFGLSYELPVAKETYLTPEIKYAVPFTNVSSSVTWKPGAIQIGASFKMPFYAPIPVPEYRDTIFQRDTTVIAIAGLKNDFIKQTKRYKPDNYKISKKDSIIFRTILKESYERQVPKAVALSSSINVVGINRDNTRQEMPTIVIEETETSESFPLLPYVFFKNNSDNLAETNLRLLKTEETREFKEKTLHWNTLDIYDDLLNIVAARMLDNPGATLTISGCNNNVDLEKGNLKLSQTRAEVVRNYLTTVWGVNPDNVKIKKQNLPEFPAKSDNPDGLTENQRTELSSTNPEILKPIVLKEVQLTANPPMIELQPQVNSELGVKGWEIVVSQDGNLIRKYNGAEVPAKLIWAVEDAPVPRYESPINIALTAFDEIDQKTSAGLDLKIQQLTIKKKRKEIKNDTIIEKYALILFDFDKADITPHQKPILEEIKQKIKSNAIVTISGYADRTGDSDYNRDLAYRRTVEVQKILQIPQDKLKLNPVGSDVLLYNNDLPQGRSYCRTVQIVIETPIKE